MNQKNNLKFFFIKLLSITFAIIIIINVIFNLIFADKLENKNSLKKIERLVLVTSKRDYQFLNQKLFILLPGLFQ